MPANAFIPYGPCRTIVARRAATGLSKEHGALRRALGTAALAAAFLAAAPMVAHAQVDLTDEPRPLRASPFRFHELARLDLRPLSPLTELSAVVAPVVPLGLAPDGAGVFLASYRYDRLRPAGHDLAVQGRSLHRLEAGTPLNFLLARDWALNLDLRVVHASDLDEGHAGGWYPNVRAGVTWAATPDLSLSVAALWTRTALGLIPVPLFGVFWRPADLPLRVEGLLPRYLEVGVPLTPTFELFTTGHWETIVWSVSSGEGSAFLTRQEIRVQAGARARVLGPLTLEVSTHWVPFQQLGIRNRTAGAQSLDDFSVTVALLVDTVFAYDAIRGEIPPAE
ncbi:MAG: hypothetical protein ACFCGT_10775 [Sandaracinaceae bacterium]